MGNRQQRPTLKRIGELMMVVGFSGPLVIHFGRRAIYRMLAGPSAVANQDAMVLVLLFYLVGIPICFALIIAGGFVRSRGKHPGRGGRGFEIEAESKGH